MNGNALVEEDDLFQFTELFIVDLEKDELKAGEGGSLTSTVRYPQTIGFSSIFDIERP